MDTLKVTEVHGTKLFNFLYLKSEVAVVLTAISLLISNQRILLPQSHDKISAIFKQNNA